MDTSALHIPLELTYHARKCDSVDNLDSINLALWGLPL